MLTTWLVHSSVLQMVGVFSICGCPESIISGCLEVHGILFYTHSSAITQCDGWCEIFASAARSPYSDVFTLMCCDSTELLGLLCEAAASPQRALHMYCLHGLCTCTACIRCHMYCLHGLCTCTACIGCHMYCLHRLYTLQALHRPLQHCTCLHVSAWPGAINGTTVYIFCRWLEALA